MKSPKNIKKTTPPIESQGIDKWWLLGIAAVAAGVRIVFAFQSIDDPFRGLLFLDSKVYHLLAVEIASTNFWGSEVFFRAPLFPYILGITYKLFGVGGVAIQVLHSILGIGTAILTYLIAEIHFDRRIARIAGLCAAAYPTLYFFELSLMPTALEVFTFTAAIYCFSRFERSRSKHRPHNCRLRVGACGTDAADDTFILDCSSVVAMATGQEPGLEGHIKQNGVGSVADDYRHFTGHNSQLYD